VAERDRETQSGRGKRREGGGISRAGNLMEGVCHERKAKILYTGKSPWAA